MILRNFLRKWSFSFPAVFLVLCTVLAVSVVQQRTITHFHAAASSGNTFAFPGAVGFGAYTPGGRGGRVIFVSNLNDSGTGSLRDALQTLGPRTIIFKIAGTIQLLNDIRIQNPYITVAGQTAPGEGIQIKGGMIKVETHDVILRYLKVRMGNPTGGNPADTDSVSIAGNNREIYNVVIDHCSLVWGTDIGSASVLTNAHDITIQDSILGEGLYLSNHPEATISQNGHSMGLNITALSTYGIPTRVSVYRNLITSSDSRMPQIIEGRNIDIVNNILYNWGAKSAFGNPLSLNLINNYFVYGPLSKTTNIWNLRIDADWPTQHDGAVYLRGNEAFGFTSTLGGPTSIYAGSQFSPYSITNELSATDAYLAVLNNAGAVLPIRDSVDQRIINNLANRSMILPNGDTNRFINAADLIWPELTGGAMPEDIDNDGMADSWETQYFGELTRGSVTDSSGDYDLDGYTDLEEYLNLTDPTVSDTQVPTVTPSVTVIPTDSISPTLEPSVSPIETPAPTQEPSPTTIPTQAPTQIPTPPLDTTAPSVTITAPRNNSKVKRSSNVTIRASAIDNMSVTKVEFLVNGTLKCTDTSSPYRCEWGVPSVSNTQYTLTARAYDGMGNVASHSISVTSN